MAREDQASARSRSPASGQTEHEQDEKTDGANRIEHWKEPAELWIPCQRAPRVNNRHEFLQTGLGDDSPDAAQALFELRLQAQTGQKADAREGQEKDQQGDFEQDFAANSMEQGKDAGRDQGVDVGEREPLVLDMPCVLPVLGKEGEQRSLLRRCDLTSCHFHKVTPQARARRGAGPAGSLNAGVDEANGEPGRGTPETSRGGDWNQGIKESVEISTRRSPRGRLRPCDQTRPLGPCKW